jgi:hypothetical protein
MTDELRAKVDAYLKQELTWERFMDEGPSAELQALVAPLIEKLERAGIPYMATQ